MHFKTRANNTIEHHDYSELEPFVFRYTISAPNIRKNIKTLEKPDKAWYLNSKAFYHLYRNKALFKYLQSISIEFSTARKKIIYFQEIDIVLILLSNY